MAWRISTRKVEMRTMRMELVDCIRLSFSFTGCF